MEVEEWQHLRSFHRVSFSFLPKGGGGQTEIVWIIGGGKYVSVCKAYGKQGESGPGKF